MWRKSGLHVRPGKPLLEECHEWPTSLFGGYRWLGLGGLPQRETPGYLSDTKFNVCGVLTAGMNADFVYGF
jgi:hypothetical protein